MSKKISTAGFRRAARETRVPSRAAALFPGGPGLCRRLLRSLGTVRRETKACSCPVRCDGRRRLTILDVKGREMLRVGILLHPEQTRILNARGQVREAWLYETDVTRVREKTHPGTHHSVIQGKSSTDENNPTDTVPFHRLDCFSQLERLFALEATTSVGSSQRVLS